MCRPLGIASCKHPSCFLADCTDTQVVQIWPPQLSINIFTDNCTERVCSTRLPQLLPAAAQQPPIAATILELEEHRAVFEAIRTDDYAGNPWEESLNEASDSTQCQAYSQVLQLCKALILCLSTSSSSGHFQVNLLDFGRNYLQSAQLRAVSHRVLQASWI